MLGYIPRTIVLERQRREMQQPGATPQELEIVMLEALKARNEVAAQAPPRPTANFISRLWRFSNLPALARYRNIAHWVLVNQSIL
jgi:hypothetical protein